MIKNTNNDVAIDIQSNMSNTTFIQGTVLDITHGENEDYDTQINFTDRSLVGKIANNEHVVSHNGEDVRVSFQTINSSKDDPVFNTVKNFWFGAVANGKDIGKIPAEAFTDNRGKYPVVQVSIIFPKRLASWLDKSHPTGIKMDLDYERMQITGSPQNEEKIQALLVLNKLLRSLKINNKIIKYDDITVFLETYHRASSGEVVIWIIHLLSGEDVYKKGVYDYLLPRLEELGLQEAAETRNWLDKEIKIETEKDLKKIVFEAVDKVLKLNIEKRRWIEPFWDGERVHEHKGQKITIPKKPKSETKIQPTLHVILDMFLKPLGIHVVRESDEGIGSLDFKFMYTTMERKAISVAVEFKLAHHKKIKHGITRQLPAYLDSIESKSGIFIVMWFKDSKFFKEPSLYEIDQMSEFLNIQAESISKSLNYDITAILINASIRPSASNS